MRSFALSPVPRINFLNALRGVAVALVLWDHLVSDWPAANGFGYKPEELEQSLILDLLDQEGRPAAADRPE